MTISIAKVTRKTNQKMCLCMMRLIWTSPIMSVLNIIERTWLMLKLYLVPFSSLSLATHVLSYGCFFAHALVHVSNVICTCT